MSRQWPQKHIFLFIQIVQEMSRNFKKSCSYFTFFICKKKKLVIKIKTSQFFQWKLWIFYFFFYFWSVFTDHHPLFWSLNNYKSKSKSFKRGKKCIQEHLYKHFESKRHTEFLDDVSITLTDKTDGSNPAKRENYWMQTLKIYAPYCCR